jgi:hypothetical protein
VVSSLEMLSRRGKKEYAKEAQGRRRRGGRTRQWPFGRTSRRRRRNGTNLAETTAAAAWSISAQLIVGHLLAGAGRPRRAPVASLLAVGRSDDISGW